jgi:hypothetical protein
MHSVIAALAAASLAAEPSFSVLVTRKVGLDASAAAQFADMLSVVLEKKGVPARRVSPVAFAASAAGEGIPDPASCGSAVDCVAIIGRKGNVDWLFAAQMAKVGTQVILDVSLVRVADGVSVAAGTERVPYRKPAKAIEKLASQFIGKMTPREPKAVPSSVEAELPAVTPPLTLPPVVAAEPAEPLPPTGSVEGKAAPSPLPLGRYVAVALGVVAVGSTGAGMYFGLSAQGQTNKLSVLSPNYNANVAQALRTAHAADACYGVAGALAIGAVIVWVLSGPPKAIPAGASTRMDTGALTWRF